MLFNSFVIKPGDFFQLEGIEDIDYIKQKDNSSDITHIQLKYSANKQDAHFLTDVLKNFLEAYLLDQNRFFKLIYDFPVAKGHLSKMFASNLDEKARAHWSNVISNIKENNPSWNWSVYDFDKFISHLSFEKIEKATLIAEIEKALIETYEITTDNVSLFANSIKILCFEKMEQRAYITKAELDFQIQSVKIDISKGPQNPAHSWICKLVEVLWNENDLSIYIPAIQGLFSGSVMKYYQSNQDAFNDANAHGGLFIISTEMCPFAVFKEFDVSIDALDKMRETFSDNKNIEYLCELRDRITACNLQETFVYKFCSCLYKKLHFLSFAEIKDISSYASISDWIYNIDSKFNLSVNISLDDVWSAPEKLTLECISTLMYISYCGNRDVYMEFVGRNLNSILTYFKQQTKSHKIFIDSEKNAII